MPLELSFAALERLSARLSQLEDKELSLVLVCLSEIGLVTTRSSRGFSFETAIECGKRRVVEELQKIFNTPKRSKL